MQLSLVVKTAVLSHLTLEISWYPGHLKNWRQQRISLYEKELLFNETLAPLTGNKSYYGPPKNSLAGTMPGFGQPVSQGIRSLLELSVFSVTDWRDKEKRQEKYNGKQLCGSENVTVSLSWESWVLFCCRQCREKGFLVLFNYNGGICVVDIWERQWNYI